MEIIAKIIEIVLFFIIGICIGLGVVSFIKLKSEIEKDVKYCTSQISDIIDALRAQQKVNTFFVKQEKDICTRIDDIDNHIKEINTRINN